MKKSILFLLVLFLAGSNLWGQCDNNASTDYTTDPTNDALPSNPNNHLYLNSFNWFPRDVNGALAKYQTFGMNQGLLLPNGEINNIYSDQTTEYYKYLSNEIEPSSKSINSVKTRKNQNETKTPIYHLSFFTFNLT